MKLKQLTLAVIAVLISVPTARAVETKGVVVTIKPLHSLVSGVVGNTGKTHLLIGGNSSPHGFKFKPSQIKLLNNASIVFYIGDSFETFLEKAFQSIPGEVIKTPVAEKARLKLLPYRKGGAWEEDKHEGHDHSNHGGEEHDVGEHAMRSFHTDVEEQIRQVPRREEEAQCGSRRHFH